MSRIIIYIKENLTLLSAGLIFELFFLLLFSVEPLRYRLGEHTLTLHNYNIFYAITFVFLFLALIYVDTSKIISRHNFKIACGFFLLFNLTLLCLWPVTSKDVFVYMAEGRMVAQGGLNPYLHTYAEFNTDSLFTKIVTPWTYNHTSVYGPFFILISAGLTWLGGGNLFLNLFLFKLFFVLLNIACGFLIYKISSNEQIFFLYAWNPLILLEFAANGHNDIITIFFLLFSIFFLTKKQTNRNYLWPYTLLLFSTLTKYLTLPLLPIFALFTSKFYKTNKEKFIYLAKLVSITLLVFLFFFAFFWQGPETLSEIRKYAFSDRVAKVIWCPFIFSFYSFAYDTPPFNNLPAIYFISRLLFLLFYALILYQIWHEPDQPTLTKLLRYFAVTIFLFLMFFFIWLVPWYFTILITLLILYYSLQRDRLSLMAAHFFLFYGILYYLLLR